MTKYRAVKKYDRAPFNPIVITRGEVLTVLEKSDPEGDWAGWVLCRGTDKEGWVPGQILKISGAEAAAAEDYSTRELNLEQGDILTALKELNGWIWCFKERDTDSPGWAPLNHLQKL